MDCCRNEHISFGFETMLCNLCGESMCPKNTINENHPHGLYRALVTGGYSSHYLLDLNRYVFSFCEKCLRNLFNQCKIKPEVCDINLDGYVRSKLTYEEDLEIFEYSDWQLTGGHHQAYLDKKCNAVKDCPNKAIYTQLIDKDFSEESCCEIHKEKRGYYNSSLVKFIPNVLKMFL